MSTLGFKRRDFLKIAGLGITSLFVKSCVKSSEQIARKLIPNRPNIILMMVDNVGFGEVGINGNDKIKTPNLDKFAGEGVQMTRFYCNPMCAPTRASLMTGRYYYRTGVIHTSRGGAKMYGDEITIGEYLKNAGYITGIFGKWHLGDNYPMRPQDQGFDQSLVHKSGRLGQVPDKPNTYFDPILWCNGQQVKTQGYRTDVFTDAAISFIEANRQFPFSVYLPTNVAHLSREVGLEVTRKYTEPYKAMRLPHRACRVYGMMTNVDENFGRLIEKLDELKLRDNTFIIFLSDDGNASFFTAGFRGSGQPSVYEGGIRVPFFTQWPGHLQKGIKTDRIASHIDILPTLLDTCGLKIPANPVLDGVSLMPLLQGKTEQWPDRTLFFQCHRGLEPHRYQNCAVVSQRYKMIGYPGTFSERRLETSIENPVLELYDLEKDPGEKRDIANENPEILAKLRAEYDIWFDEMKHTRNFEPGIIHIGSDFENPTYLSHYQDSSYVNRKPIGWPVFIERSGKYEFAINRGSSLEESSMYVVFNNKEMSKPLNAGENKAEFSLTAGKGMLNVYVKKQDEPYKPRSEQDKIGDIEVERI